MIKKSLTSFNSYGMGGFAYLLKPSMENFNEAMAMLGRFDESHPFDTSKIVRNKYHLSGNPVVVMGPDEVLMTLLYPKWYHLGVKYGTTGWKRNDETVIIHFVTMKPWDELEKKGEPVYTDFEIWYKFTAMYIDKYPTLKALVLSGNHGEEILRRIKVAGQLK